MVGPLLSSKYRLPVQRVGALSRQRLTHRLAVVVRTPLTVVSAPAGFGKTTLLGDWLAGADGMGPLLPGCRWTSRDNDPALFWTYVVTAMQRGRARTRRRRAAPSCVTILTGGGRARCSAQRSRGPAERSRACAWTTTTSSRRRRYMRAMTFLLEHQPPQAASGPRHPRRPAAAAGTAARPRPTGRGASRRPAIHIRGSDGLSQRLDGSGAERG